MIVQVYKDDGQVRIFDRYNTLLAMVDLKPELELRISADNALKRLRMKRCERWCDVDWGIEAKIRFMEKKR